ncbi:unnamed protein product [Taphrina deformans PYCC 5710]|uniref:Uncharacterized protein n=1 Tax=Taphrina deformans (strain PYCC 5710 / ATCC 11124 / CBS 356.35 / IMI 108563 / JCM 9778 / NBRC 8474) TaxID=1097556 RepID=R4XE52_TAPDE|nr:unnamed protein product [Taphrina deformans PYCC 5710]|eukprot:CCG84085.1 unnamed protein product [Taphrina deformans PYCC 5710]
MNNAEQVYKAIQADKKIPIEIRKADQFVALILVAKSRNLKHAAAILHCFNRLLAGDSVEQGQIKDIIESLQALAGTNTDIQVKVLQTIPLVFINHTNLLQGATLASCLSIPISLLDVNGMVGNIASATLQQVLVSLFDTPSQSREADVSRIFEDLCATLSRTQTGFVSFDRVKLPVVLELLESILAGNSSLFELHPSLLDANLVPSIISLVTGVTTRNQVLIRVIRLCTLLIPSRGALLVDILRFLPNAPSQRQVLILEALEQCIDRIEPVQHSSILSTLLFFEDTLPGLGTYSLCTIPKDVDDQITAEGLIYSDNARLMHEQQGVGEWCRPNKSLLSQLHSADFPKAHQEYKSLLICNILSRLSQSPIQIWQDSLTLHSAILSSSISSSLEKQVLVDISEVILKLDRLEDKRARDLYLRRLGRIAVSSSLQIAEPSTPTGPSSTTGDMAHRSFACLDIYLQVTTKLRNSFDVRAWRQVLDILDRADALLSMRNRRSNRQNGSLMANVLNSEEKSPASNSAVALETSRLSSSIEQFFRTINQIENEPFSFLIEAICSMQLGLPSSPTASTPGSRFNSPIPMRRLNSGSSLISFKSAHHSLPTTVFALEKLKDFAPSNVFRFVDTEVACGWNVLLGHLADEIRAENFVAAEIMGTMIIAACNIGLRTTDQQSRFIDALVVLNGDVQIKVVQLETLAGMLEIVGHDLTCGWETILRILHGSMSERSLVNAEVVRLGFSCLNLICTDLLASISREHMALLIKTLVEFASQEEALNISLSAVGHFWTILRSLTRKSDFCAPYRQFPKDGTEAGLREDEFLWLFFMENVIHITHDSRPEVRNMAIQACFRTIDVAEALGQNIWLSAIYLLLQELQGISLQLSSENEGYVETVNAITGGCGKILLSSGNMLDDSQEAMPVWSLVCNYMKTIVIQTRSETAAFALTTMSQIVTNQSDMSTEVQHNINEVNWEITIASGQGLFEKTDGSMTQEGLTTFFTILLHLLEGKTVSLLSDDLVDRVMKLVYQGLTYPRSKTYYLDVDYLSTVQKPILQILRYFYGQCPASNSSVTQKITQIMLLPTLAHQRADEYVYIQQKSTNWSGRPTFVALSMALQDLVSEQYSLAQDADLSALTQIVESANALIRDRFTRASIADKTKTHQLWISATNQVIRLAKSMEARLHSSDTRHLWYQLVETGHCLMKSHEDQSEEFVLGALNQFRDIIFPAVGSQSSDLIDKYVESIYRGSWFYEQTEVIEPSTAASSYYGDQIIREWCFLDLFKLSISSTGAEAGDGEAEGTHLSRSQEEWDRCAQAAVPYAIQRAQNILHRYINNARLRGHAPLPRIEYAELLLLLDHLGDDTITHPNQRKLLKNVYVLVVEALLINQGDEKVLRLLKETLMRVAPFL